MGGVLNDPKRMVCSGKSDQNKMKIGGAQIAAILDGIESTPWWVNSR